MNQAHHERNTVKNYPRAIELYQAAIACEPTALAYLSIGGAFTLIGQDNEAEAAYRTALTLEPDPVVRYRSLGELAGVLLRRGEYENAIDLATQSIAIDDEKYPTAWAIRAQALEHLKQWDRALGDRARIVELAPSSWHAYYSRGLVYAELGQSDMAAEDFEQAIRLNPDRPEPAAALEATPRMSWAMAERYEQSWNALDGNARIALDPDDPKYAYYTTVNPVDLEVPSRGHGQGVFDRSILFPAGYETTISACGATEWLTPARGLRWKFSVIRNRPRSAASEGFADYTPVHTTLDSLPSEPISYSVGCTWNGLLPEGDIRVSVEPINGSGSFTDTILVRDLLIVSIGDSIASGEGNPPFRNNRCHRSETNEHARAAERLESRSEHYSVTFVSLACSGAKIDAGVLAPYSGTEWGYPALPSQVDQLADLLCLGSCARQGEAPQVDLMLISAGANDLGFSDILRECVEDDCISEEQVETTAAEAQSLVGGTSGFRSFLDVRSALEALGIEPTRTIVTQYNTDLFSSSGDGKGYAASCVGEGAPGYALRTSEAKFISEELAPLLKDAVTRGAVRAGWEVTTDPTALFWGHGMCMDKPERWIVQIDIGDMFWSTKWGLGFGGLKPGPAHPNRKGHKVLAGHLISHIDSWRPESSPIGPPLRADYTIHQGPASGQNVARHTR